MAIPKTPQIPGVLGVEYAPFHTQYIPRARQPFTVRGMTLSGGLTNEKLERRQKLLDDLDSSFDALEKDSGLPRGLDRFSQRELDAGRTCKAKCDDFHSIARRNLRGSGIRRFVS